MGSESMSSPHRTKSSFDHYHSPQNAYHPYTNSLLMELHHWQQAHRLVEERSNKEEKTYRDVEDTLFEKIEKYDDRFDRKIAALIQCYPEAADIDVEETIDRIIDLDDRITEMKEEIHRKKWFEDRNQFYRKLVQQQMLRENIDGLTQKIRYFEHLIMNHVNAANESSTITELEASIPPPRHSDDDNTVSIVTPFVVKEALRIKAENQKDLNGLRAQLDELRKNRQ